MASALHPQTLLCYEMDGQPLTPEHGAPLRLVIPLKYGIKNLKRIGDHPVHRRAARRLLGRTRLRLVRGTLRCPPATGSPPRHATPTLSRDQGACRTMKAIRLTLALGFPRPTLAVPLPVAAQERAADGPSGRFAALEELDASYRRQLHDLECRRIADLADLAEKAPGPEADAAYRHLFGLAIARELCREAQTAASRCLASTSAGRDIRALAALVQVLARTDKGEHDQALDDWKNLLKESARGPDAALDADLALAVGEALLQRLIREGRYDVARKLCGLACAGRAPAPIRDHFAGSDGPPELLGKPAPAIAATDVDGKPVSLAELKGRVVLVDFWATWCPPCVASIPALNELARKYHDRGFVILGVNVDAMHEDVQEMKKALPAVRRFLVRHRVTWTNLLNGQGAADFASAYGVEEIPANFLIGRDGKIVAVEQSGDALERAVVDALGNPDRTTIPVIPRSQESRS